MPRCTKEVGERGAPRQGDVTPPPDPDAELCVPGVQATHRSGSTCDHWQGHGTPPPTGPREDGDSVGSPGKDLWFRGKISKNQDALEVHLGHDHWDCGIGKSFVLI